MRKENVVGVKKSLSRNVIEVRFQIDEKPFFVRFQIDTENWRINEKSAYIFEDTMQRYPVCSLEHGKIYGYEIGAEMKHWIISHAQSYLRLLDLSVKTRKHPALEKMKKIVDEYMVSYTSDFTFHDKIRLTEMSYGEMFYWFVRPSRTHLITHNKMMEMSEDEIEMYLKANSRFFHWTGKFLIEYTGDSIMKHIQGEKENLLRY